MAETRRPKIIVKPKPPQRGLLKVIGKIPITVVAVVRKTGRNLLTQASIEASILCIPFFLFLLILSIRINF